MPIHRRAFLSLGLAALAACGLKKPASKTDHPGRTPEMDRLVDKYARLYDMPASLIHRVIQRESDYNAAARNGFCRMAAKTRRFLGMHAAIITKPSAAIC